MMRAFFFVFLLLQISCDQDDKAEDCSLVDCFVQSFFIELVDIDGNNLIENETYSREEIEVYKNGALIGKVFDNQEYNNLIAFILASGVGNTDFEIRLSEQETDLLTLNLSIKQTFECCPPEYEVLSATYNGEPKDLMTGILSGSQKITVVK